MSLSILLLLSSTASAFETTVYLTVTKTIAVTATPSPLLIYHPMLPKVNYPYSNTSQLSHENLTSVPMTSSDSQLVVLPPSDIINLQPSISYTSYMVPTRIPRVMVDIDGHGQLILGVEGRTSPASVRILDPVLKSSKSLYETGTHYPIPEFTTTTTLSELTKLILQPEPATTTITTVASLSSSSSLSKSTTTSSLPSSTKHLLLRSSVRRLSLITSTTIPKTRALPLIKHCLPDMSVFKRNYTFNLHSGSLSMLLELSYVWGLLLGVLCLCLV